MNLSPRKLKRVLEKMSPEEYADFQKRVTSHVTKKEYASLYEAYYPDWENKVLAALDLKTQEELQTEAAISSAKSDRLSAYTYVVIAIATLVSIAVTIFLFLRGRNP